MTGLEAIKYLNDTCVNFLDRTKELYCTVTFTRKRAEILRDNIAEVEKSLKALEILKRNMKVSIEYGVEKRDISCALVFYIDNKKTIYVVDEAIKEQSPEHFKELELLKEVLE